MQKINNSNKNNPVLILERIKASINNELKQYNEYYKSLKNNFERFMNDAKKTLDKKNETLNVFDKWINASERIDFDKEFLICKCKNSKEMDEIDKFLIEVFCLNEERANEKLTKIYDIIFRDKNVTGRDIKEYITFEEKNLDYNNIKDLVDKINCLINRLKEELNVNITKLDENNITNKKILKKIIEIHSRLKQVHNDLSNKINLLDKHIDGLKTRTQMGFFLECIILFLEILNDDKLLDVAKKSQGKLKPKIKIKLDKHVFVNNFRITTKYIKNTPFTTKDTNKIKDILKKLNIIITDDETDDYITDLINYIKNEV